jgi:transposase
MSATPYPRKPTVSETALSQRQQIIALTTAGHSAAAIARHLGLSPRTITRWRARYRHAGEAGLAYRSRRPQTRHPQTTPAASVAPIPAIREAHPGWGARLIQRQLRLDGVAHVPSERTIHAWLGRLGYGPVRPRAHAGKPLGWQPPAPQPHDTVWEVDFKKKGGPVT